MTIYFLGPSTDDYDDARRLLAQSLQSPDSLSDKTIAVFGASQNTAVVPVPTEVGNVLPFNQRIREWSRWANSIKRKNDNDAVKIKRQSKTPEVDGQAELKHATWQTERRQRLLSPFQSEKPPFVPHSPHWQVIPRQSKSVTIGRVIYPTEVVQRVHKKIISRWKRGGALLPDGWRNILGPHEFLSSRNGLVLVFAEYISQERELLCIKLSPKTTKSQLANDGEPSSKVQAPALEIDLDIDRDRQCVAVNEVRAVLKTAKTDLMLPPESNDLRFESQLLAISSAELDPSLSAFIKSSNLDVWGSERLKTPSSLVLDVPRFVGYRQNTIEQLGPVEYNFTALEHRTQLFVERENYRYEHTVIEAGLAGGQREEFRINFQNSVGESLTTCRKLFLKATGWINDMSLVDRNKDTIVNGNSLGAKTVSGHKITKSDRKGSRQTSRGVSKSDRKRSSGTGCGVTKSDRKRSGETSRVSSRATEGELLKSVMMTA